MDNSVVGDMQVIALRTQNGAEQLVDAPRWDLLRNLVPR